MYKITKKSWKKTGCVETLIANYVYNCADGVDRKAKVIVNIDSRDCQISVDSDQYYDAKKECWKDTQDEWSAESIEQTFEKYEIKVETKI